MDSRIILGIGFVLFICVGAYMVYGLSQRAKTDQMKAELKASKARLDEALKKAEGIRAEIRERIEAGEPKEGEK